jgi:hypothetical protein
MKNKENLQKESASDEQKINRKQAIKRAGFYAVTAAGMITLLGSPKKSAGQVTSLPPAPTPWT